MTNIDDISGLSVAEIELSGGYSISGEPITLAGSGGVGIDSQTGTNRFSDAITLGANLTFTQDAGQLNLGGVISGSQDLTKGGPGTLVLGGVNTYTGGTTISAGTIKDGIENALPTGTVLTVDGTGKFDLAGFAQTVAGLADGGVGTGTVTDSGDAATFTVNNGATNTFSGLITNGANALSLTKTGAGSLTLAHVNTYTGATTISAGTIKDGIENALPTGTVLTVDGTGTFDLGGHAQTVAGLADGGVPTGTVTDSGAAATFTVNDAADNSFSGKITNGAGAQALALTKTGAGTLTLSGTNTYSGATTISAGTIKDGVLDALPIGATLTVDGTGTFDLAGFDQTVAGLADGGVPTGTVTDSSSTTPAIFTVNSVAASSFSGTIAQALALTKTGAGTLTLSGTNTYSGATTISAGTLQVGNGGTTDILGSGNVVDNALLSFDRTDTDNGLTLANTISGTGSVSQIGSGTTTLSADNNTYRGGTTVSAGTLEDGVADALPPGAPLTVDGTGTFDLAGHAQIVAGLADGGVSTGIVTDSGAAATFTVNSVAASSFSGTITNGANALALTKTGAGTLTLSGNNPYTGTTTVTAGTLLVNGSQSKSAVTVARGAILGGTNGTVDNVSVPGGTVSPGAAASSETGILNSGNVTFSSTAAFNVDLDGTTAGNGYDQLSATGTVALGNSTALNVSGRVYSCRWRKLHHHQKSQRHLRKVCVTAGGDNIRRGRTAFPDQL